MPKSALPAGVNFTICLLAIVLFASALTFNYGVNALFVSDTISSLLLLILALRSRKDHGYMIIWAMVFIGIWLQFAPLLFYAKTGAAYVTDTLIGASIIALLIIFSPIFSHSQDAKPTMPPGWSYNPSSWAQRFPIAFFAFVCWMLSRYLCSYQLGYIDTAWDPFFSPGTQGVLDSEISKAFPISDAGLGAFAYTMEFFSVLAGATNRWRTAPWLVLVFGILVIPVSLVSTILIILQPLAVGTWCTICLVTAACMLIPIPFAIGEVAATIQFLLHSKDKSFLEVLMFGAPCPGEKEELNPTSMQAPILTILKASLSGITLPWNLVISALIGIIVMMLGSFTDKNTLLYTVDPIVGAFIAITSIVSLAEYVRSYRYLNMLFGSILLILTMICFFQQPINLLAIHFILAILVIVLAKRKGAIKERWSFKHSAK